jgi:Uma2 family endonuclease
VEPIMTAAARHPRKLTIEEFLAFYDTRPDEERWQLIDGVALLMTPPFATHQIIAGNLERLLNDALEAYAPEWIALQRVGVEQPEFPHYRPEPDVAVVELPILPDQRHFDRFYLAAEVLSESNDDDRVDFKRDYYRAHDANRAILLISQDRQELALDRRSEDGGWQSEVLRGPEAVLSLPEFGLNCSLGALYRKTHLEVTGPGEGPRRSAGSAAKPGPKPR